MTGSPRGNSGCALTSAFVRLKTVPLLKGKLLDSGHAILVRSNVSRSSPRGWRQAQPRPQRLLQACVTDVQVHMMTVAKVRAPARIELDLQEVVEAVVDVVLRFGAATVATELKTNDCGRTSLILMAAPDTAMRRLAQGS